MSEKTAYIFPLIIILVGVIIAAVIARSELEDHERRIDAIEQKLGNLYPPEGTER